MSNPQVNARFREGETYVRIRESGLYYPFHKELAKMVRKEQADFVIYKGNGKFEKTAVAIDPEQPVKIVSTPARKPEVVGLNAPEPTEADLTISTAGVPQGPPSVVKVATLQPNLPVTPAAPIDLSTDPPPG